MADDIVPLKEYRRGEYAMPDVTQRLAQVQDQMAYRVARERYRRAQLVVAADAVTPKTGNKMREVLRMYPGVSAVGLASVVDLPDTPESEVIRNLLTLDSIVRGKEVAARVARQDSPTAKAETGQNPTSDGGFNLMGAIRGTVRNVFEIADASVRALQGGIRSAYGAVSEDDDWGEALRQIGGILPPVAAGFELAGAYDRPNPWEQTTFGQSIYAALGVPEEGGTLNDTRIGEVPTKAFGEAQGTGWFLDPESEVAQRQRRAVRTAAPLTSQGEAWTLGRGFTDASVVDPDTTGGRFLSGFIDAAAVLFLDPLIFAGGAAKVGRGAQALETARARSATQVAARDVLKAQDEAAELPARIAELSQIRDEMRAARILADARGGAAKYTAVDQAGKVNAVKIADLEQQAQELALAEQRARHALDLISREEKVLAKSAKYSITPQGTEQVSRTAAPDLVDEIEQMFEQGLKPGERTARLVEAFDSGVDPIQVRTVWQQLGLWRKRNGLWRAAMKQHDIAKGQAARAAADEVATEAQQALSDLTPAEIVNGLNDLTRATDLPGTILHTPQHMPYSRYVDNPVTPFDNTDDVFVALVDGEPGLIRLPKVEQGQRVAFGEGARVAEQAADVVEDLGPLTKSVIPMHNGNSLRFTKGGTPRHDVTDAGLERITQGVGKAYTEAGDLVDITDFRVATIESTGRLSKAKETVPVTGGGTLDDLSKTASKKTIAAPSEGGSIQAAARVVDAQDAIPGAVWREIVDRLPDAVASGPGRTMLADLAKGKGGPLSWGEVIEFAKRYDVVAELTDLLMLNGVIAVKGLGRSRAHTWVPDTLGASVTFINKARVKGGVIAPPPVTQASIRKVRYQQRAAALKRDHDAALREIDDLRKAQTTSASKAKVLWDSYDKQRAVVTAKAEQARRALEAGEDVGLDALADDLAETLKDLMHPRAGLDGERSIDLTGVAQLLDPKRGRLVRPFGHAVDRLLGRIGADGMMEEFAKIKNPAVLNRLAKGRWDREFLLDLASADNVDDVRLLIASRIADTPDVLEGLARSRRKVYTGWRGGSVSDRVARQLEIVSTRNPAVDLSKPEQGALYINQWLRTIGMPQDQVDDYVATFIRAADEPERADVLMHSIADGLRDDLLAKSGVDIHTPLGARIQRETRIFGEHFKETQGWFQERIADGVSVNGGLVGGEWVDFSGPHLLMELADSVVRLPDVTELRRFNTWMGRKIAGEAGERGKIERIVDWGNRVNDLWRTWLLVRGAYVVRNILETQMRAYVLGSHNAITNPLMFLGMMTSVSNSKTARALRPFFKKMDDYNTLAPGVDMSFFQRNILDPDDLNESGQFADEAIRLFNENVHGGAAPQDFRAVQATVTGYEPKLVTIGDPYGNIGHAREMMVLRSDPVVRVVAGEYPDTVARAIEKGAPIEDAVLDWLFTSKQGKEILATRHASAPKQAKDASAWMDREWVRGYLFDWPGSVRARISAATGDNTYLIDYLRTGRLTNDDGKVLYHFDPVRKRRELAAQSSPRSVAKEGAASEAEEYLMSRAISEVGARADVPKTSRFTAMVRKEKDRNLNDRAADWFFRWSGDLERTAAWNPEFRITYIRHSLQYLDNMHPEDAIAWLDAVTPSMPKVRALKDMPGTKLVGGRADFSDLYKHQRQRLRDIGPKAESTQSWATIDDMKSIAGQAASAHNRDMFYAALNQQNFWHAARFAIPFGQPTVNAYRVFSRSVLDWTNVVTRHYPAMRAIGELQSEGSSVINEAVDVFEPGDDANANRPFLYREQEDGPLKMRIPMVGGVLGGVAGWLTGDDGLMNSRMDSYLSSYNLALQGVQPMPEGLSNAGQAAFLAANAFPTVGWTVQTAAAWTPLDEQYGPGWNEINQWIWPFSRPQGGGPEEALWNFMPTWMKRMQGTGWFGNGELAARARASNLRGVLGYHASRNTGTDWTTPAGKEELLARADRDARILTLFQAIGTFFLPAAPQWAYEAVDKDGTAYAQVFIADEWRQIQERTGDWDQAILEFMDRFGENAALVITPSTAGEPTLSEEAWEALQEDDSLKNYREVLPLFYPGDISWVAYEWQKKQGYRQNLSPQERIDNAYRLVYQMQETELDRRALVEGWSDDRYEQEKQVLQDRWPAGRPKGTHQFLTSQERLKLVASAIEDVPYLAESEVGKATAQALERYDYYVEIGGNKTLTGTSVAAQRDAFREEVDWLFGAVPGGDAMARLFYQATEEAA